jgi:hypothetical protein
LPLSLMVKSVGATLNSSGFPGSPVTLSGGETFPGPMTATCSALHTASAACG